MQHKNKAKIAIWYGGKKKEKKVFFLYVFYIQPSNELSTEVVDNLVSIRW